jgi:hypothetical protein
LQYKFFYKNLLKFVFFLQVGEIDGNSVTVQHDSTSIDLSQLSQTARFQLTTVDSSKAAVGEEATPVMQLAESQDGSLENVLLCEDLSEVSMDEQGQEQVEQLNSDASGSYVDVKIKEGQIMRLKVPFNIDPVVYASEYLQQAVNVNGRS